MDVKTYGLKILSIVMNALGVVSGVQTGAVMLVVPTVVLLVSDLNDLKAMVLQDMKATEEQEEE